jgi:hypothetical protein
MLRGALADVSRRKLPDSFVRTAANPAIRPDNAIGWLNFVCHRRQSMEQTKIRENQLKADLLGE